jgi:hypothetical protein
VEKFNRHIAITGHLTRINLDSRISNVANRRHIDYKTATSTRLGVSFDYRWLAFELFTRLPVEETNKKGSTQNSGIYGRINKSRFWANLIFQRFRGFYWSNPSPAAANGLPKGYFPIRPDIRNTLIQTSANYVFSPDRFSNPASQGENEWQTKSGGSFLAGFGYYGNYFRGDSSLIPVTEQKAFPDINQALRINSWMLTAGGGYAHCWVYKKHWFASIYAITGLARFNANTYTQDGERYQVRGKWNMRLETRVSIGYNTPEYFAGMLLSSFVNNQDLGTDSDFSYGFSTLRLYIGRSFTLNGSLGWLGL